MTIHVGDCRGIMRRLAPGSAQCVVTSPPYYGLRLYGTEPQVWGGRMDCDDHAWRAAPRQPTKLGSGGNTNGHYANGRTNPGKIFAPTTPAPPTTLCSRCGAWRGELGGEPVVSRYIENLREVFDAVWHVLADDGVLWLNIGDSYAGSGRGAGSLKMGYVQRNSRGTHGVPPDRDKSVRAKNLYGIPWRLALALQQDGWNIRADVVWHKPNPMPESVKDRPTRSHEHVFMLTKRTHGYRYHADQLNAIVNPDANTRDVWSIQPAKFPGAHFATFPTELVERCIAAGSTVGEVVFDPFAGAGTTGMVARQMGRRFVGAEINEEYASMARSRIASATPRLEMAT